MKLENEFTVPASIDEAWAFLLDVPRVAPCLPGATVEDGGGDEGEYQGAMKIKIGPISASYKGTVRIQEADEAAHRVAMRAQAKDARGQGTAAATITSTMEETSDGTKVHVETDMRVTGPAAQFGRGVMQDVSAKLMKRFADCLAEELSGGGAAQEPATTANAAAAPATETAGATGGATASDTVSETGVAGASSGVSTAETEPAVPSASSGASTAKSSERRTEDVLDLGEASRDAVLKRALPVAGALVALLILLRVIRR
jgi:carbon monoxide dehydrogenase subunit G